MVRRLILVALLAGCGGEHNPEGEPRDRTVVPDCDITLDGSIERDEVAAAPGLEALYVRNDPALAVPVAVDGWDFSEGPRDVGLRVRLEDPAANGFAPRFPTAGWTVPAALETPDLLTPARLGDDGIELLGAGTADGAWDLAYDEPLLAMPLPLEVGDAWAARAVFRDARLGGFPNAGIEEWTFEVEAAGTAELPGGVTVDDVLRVHSTVVRDLTIGPDEPITEHRIQWFAPCFGEVARVVLPDPDADTATEYRRLEP